MRSLVALLVLAGPMFAQPIQLGPEIPVSRVEYSPLEGGVRPQVATDGTNFLAVWTDERGAWAARFSADGTPLDPLGIHLGGHYARGVIWSGHHYLIVLTRHVVAIDRDGVIRHQHTLPDETVQMREVRLATNGTNVLAVAPGRAFRLDLDGKPLGSMPLAQKAIFSDGGGDVASNGGDYAVVVAEPDRVTIQRVTSSGTVQVPAVLYNGRASHVAIASSGATYVVAWASPDSLFTQEIGADLALRSERHTIATTALKRLRIARREGGYVLTHEHDDLTLFATRLDALGARAADPVTVAAPAFDAHIASDHGHAALVWIDAQLGVRAGVLDEQSLTLEATTSLSRAAHPQYAPRVVRAGGLVVLGWFEEIAGTYQLRISTAARQEPVIVANTQSFFEILFDGAHVWVLWTDGVKLNVRRYTTSLTAVDAEPWQFPTRGYFVAAAGERGVLVVGTDTISGTAIRVEGDSLVATDVVLADNTDNLPDRDPAVAWNGREYVVAWVHLLRVPFWQFPQPVPVEIQTVRVTREGVRADAAPIVVQRRDDPTFVGPLRAASAHGGGVVLAWEDPQNTYATIFRGEPFPDVRTIGGQELPSLDSIVSTTGGYLLASSTSGPSPALIRLRRLSVDLAVEGEMTIPGIRSYDVTAVGSMVFLAYARTASEPEYGNVSRVFLRHSDPPGGRRRSAGR